MTIRTWSALREATLSHFDEELPIDPDLAPDDPGEPTTHPTAVVSGRLTARRARPDVLGVLALGGAIGTLARATLGQVFPTTVGGFPATTFAINIIGSLLLGASMVVLVELVGPTRRLRPFLTTGVLGGFTTFSTFMVETARLGHQGHITVALLYLVAASFAGITAGFAGIAFGRYLVRRTLAESVADEIGSAP